MEQLDSLSTESCVVIEIVDGDCVLAATVVRTTAVAWASIPSCEGIAIDAHGTKKKLYDGSHGGVATATQINGSHGGVVTATFR